MSEEDLVLVATPYPITNFYFQSLFLVAAKKVPGGKAPQPSEAAEPLSS